jgi:hypothetical protein
VYWRVSDVGECPAGRIGTRNEIFRSGLLQGPTWAKNHFCLWGFFCSQMLWDAIGIGFGVLARAGKSVEVLLEVRVAPFGCWRFNL